MNDLLAPQPESRLGTRGVGAEEVRAQSWMIDMDWYALGNKNITAPYIPGDTKAPATLTEKYTGDNGWCDTFTSFTNKN